MVAASASQASSTMVRASPSPPAAASNTTAVVTAVTSPPASVRSLESGRVRRRSCADCSMANPATNAHMQPRPPQKQTGPFIMTLTCPNSPA